MDIVSFMTIVGLATFAPICIWRIVLCCKEYIYTGEFGHVSNSLLFQVLDKLVESEEDPIKWSAFFFEPHPVSIIADCMAVLLTCIFLGLFYNVPVLLGIVVALVSLALVLRLARKRVAKKQEFEGRLRGDWKNV